MDDVKVNHQTKPPSCSLRWVGVEGEKPRVLFRSYSIISFQALRVTSITVGQLSQQRCDWPVCAPTAGRGSAGTATSATLIDYLPALHYSFIISSRSVKAVVRRSVGSPQYDRCSQREQSTWGGNERDSKVAGGCDTRGVYCLCFSVWVCIC